MKRNNPTIPFERYADDAICHCSSPPQAMSLKEALEDRFNACKLEVHQEKTKIVYCKRAGKHESHDVIKFDFLGFTFRPRLAKTRTNTFFVSFFPAISKSARRESVSQ